MLTELQISNFAIIEHQSVTFSPGLNVITGETGAGKSIILHAIELILGGRPKAHMLRTGATEAEVQALFNLEGLPQSVIDELPDMARAQELVISRTIGEGRSKVYINGRLGTVSLLEEIVSKFVNICGQNQHVRLLNASYHLQLLDGYAKNETLLGKYGAVFNDWKQLTTSLKEHERALARSVARKSELEDTVLDLKKAGLKPGLRDELEATIKRLSNSESLIGGAQEILGAFSEEGGLASQLQRLSSLLHDLQRVDPRLYEIGALFSSAKTELDEFDRDLKRYVGSVEVNDDLLSNLRDTLADIARLHRKYRTGDDGLIELLSRSEKELSIIDGSIDLEELKRQADQKFSQLRSLALELTQKREKAGNALGRVVEAELSELSMKGTILSVAIDRIDFGPLGQDSAQFLISTNKGESAKPLRQVASGGELSRIMLVLKKVLKDQTGVNVLVFDEVDTGVSGSVARAVGEKLQQLAAGSQVICITHLPQVASLADQHLLVAKRETSNKSGKRTVSEIRILSSEDRVDEVARMLAGHEITNATRVTAQELLGKR